MNIKFVSRFSLIGVVTGFLSIASASVVASPSFELTACDAVVNVFDPDYDDCAGAFLGTDTGAKGIAETLLNDDKVFGAGV